MKKLVVLFGFFLFFFSSCKKEEPTPYTHVHFTGIVVNKQNGNPISGATLYFRDYWTTLDEGSTVTGADGRFDAIFERRGDQNQQTITVSSPNFYPIQFLGYRQPANSFTPDKKWRGYEYCS